MRRLVVLASVWSVMILGVTMGSALALDCQGRLVVIGASPWEVQERCGEPTAIEDVMKYIPQRAYDPSQGTVDILVPVQQSIWTYNQLRGLMTRARASAWMPAWTPRRGQRWISSPDISTSRGLRSCVTLCNGACAVGR
jgi:hypothetical protein